MVVCRSSVFGPEIDMDMQAVRGVPCPHLFTDEIDSSSVIRRLYLGH